MIIGWSRACCVLAALMATWSIELWAQRENADVNASAALPECTIAARQVGADIVVKVTLTNRMSSPYKVLKWNLPRDGVLTGVLFGVVREGSDVAYVGPMVKRSVTADSYETIAPGKSLSVEIHLQQAYDVRQHGRYSIVYRVSNQRLDSSASDSLRSSLVTVTKR